MFISLWNAIFYHQFLNEKIDFFQCFKTFKNVFISLWNAIFYHHFFMKKNWFFFNDFIWISYIFFQWKNEFFNGKNSIFHWKIFNFFKDFIQILSFSLKKIIYWIKVHFIIQFHISSNVCNKCTNIIFFVHFFKHV